MRFEGTLVKWDDARGFGFVRPVEGGADVFVHITSFPFGTGRPDVGEQVSFEIEESDKGPRAAQVMSLRTIKTESVAEPVLPGRTAGPVAVIVLFAIALVVVASSSGLEVVWLLLWLGIYTLFSLFAVFLYGRDKAAALNRERRTPEVALLMNSLLGGWPGALIAQQRLRHKTRKASFQVKFWLVVLLNISVVFTLVSPYRATVGRLARDYIDKQSLLSQPYTEYPEEDSAEP